MNRKLAVHLVEDSDDWRLRLARFIREAPELVGRIELFESGTMQAAQQQFEEHHPDILITDLMLPMDVSDGFGLISFAKKLSPDVYVAVLTIRRDADLQGRIDAVADDLWLKTEQSRDKIATRLLTAIKAVVDKKSAAVSRIVSDSNSLAEAFIGDSEAIRRIRDEVQLVLGAPSDTVPVLIQGETGTGKEVLANAIHKHGSRSRGPFVPFNCCAVTDALQEDELFGHEKGAFTGATYTRKGKFEEANGGTLFIDEIGDVKLDKQVKLLRALQERMINRIGGSLGIRVDVRIIAATNRNLEDAVAQGQFREDLYYRLNVIPIRLPPLRERMDDLRPLFTFLSARYAANWNCPKGALSEDAAERLAQYKWPGNVRQLENCVTWLYCRFPNQRVWTGKEVTEWPDLKTVAVKPSIVVAPAPRDSVTEVEARAVRWKAELEAGTRPRMTWTASRDAEGSFAAEKLYQLIAKDNGKKHPAPDILRQYFVEDFEAKLEDRRQLEEEQHKLIEGIQRDRPASEVGSASKQNAQRENDLVVFPLQLEVVQAALDRIGSNPSDISKQECLQAALRKYWSEPKVIDRLENLWRSRFR